MGWVDAERGAQLDLALGRTLLDQRPPLRPSGVHLAAALLTRRTTRTPTVAPKAT
jgi:hypothetical protein